MSALWIKNTSESDPRSIYSPLPTKIIALIKNLSKRYGQVDLPYCTMMISDSVVHENCY